MQLAHDFTKEVVIRLICVLQAQARAVAQVAPIAAVALSILVHFVGIFVTLLILSIGVAKRALYPLPTPIGIFVHITLGCALAEHAFILILA